MDSLGIGPSFDLGDGNTSGSDSSEEEDEGIKVVIQPKGIILTSPTKPKRNSHLVVESENLTKTPERNHDRKESPSPKRKSSSSFHDTARAKRSDEEQQRIDKIHEIFHRVGLMSRQKRDPTRTVSAPEPRGKEVDAQSEQNCLAPQGSQENADASEPSASDLIRAWRTRDQTLPKMNGKLF
jgi:hypothetical protein